ncbi:MAG: tRNA pseudouridine(55) synthase TruB, partial [Gammaproteobacteria bacterium]|nr:tRNA pseudouridine(55) synthase TruB [Gammaproteobacteria bacterium]
IIENLAKQGNDVLDELLVPVDSALEHLAAIALSEEATYSLCQGQAVLVSHAPGEKPGEGLVRIYDHNHAFIGVGTINEAGRVAPKRLVKTNNIN